MQLGPINSGTCQAFDGAWIELTTSSKLHRDVRWYDPGFARDEMQHFTCSGEAIAPIINSLAAVEKRLEKIKSMQLKLKKTNDEGQKDIM
ncbi:hypothetical protein CJ030_MR5G020694 [Morella rubra]|uniref:Uncharacterized protein n=1 Tax=Morella rubra TaxID=262757 RepID=A0A6A1VHQ7_9ROSI|nr:hypothetical protein CJ030_MR5G020694 [Morella rubra]